MKIYAPYASCEVEVVKECGHSTIDKVERGGYRPNSEKIDDFISTGNIVSLSRSQDSEAELPSEESEFEPDSEEYRDELTKDAENFDEEPLPQFMDKLTAEEILDNSDKLLKEREKLASEKKLARKDKKKSDADKIVEAIERGFKNQAEHAGNPPA